MFEDIAGTQSAGTQRRYATCAECGQLFLSNSLRDATTLEDNGYSEIAEICPSCDALDRQGETIPVSEEEY
jgi:hypothetical protein